MTTQPQPASEGERLGYESDPATGDVRIVKLEEQPKAAVDGAESSGFTPADIDIAHAICETVKEAHGVWLGMAGVAELVKQLGPLEHLAAHCSPLTPEEKALSAPAAAERGSGWRPIAEAPKTRQSILVYCPGNRCIFVVYWQDWHPKGWHYFGGGGAELLQEPSHWQPLPAAPSHGESQELEHHWMNFTHLSGKSAGLQAAMHTVMEDASQAFIAGSDHADALRQIAIKLRTLSENTQREAEKERVLWHKFQRGTT
jgi:hypothetical protein